MPGKFATIDDLVKDVKEFQFINDLTTDFNYPSDHLPHAVKLLNMETNNKLRVMTYNPLAEDYLPHITGNPIPRWYVENGKTDDFFANGQQLYKTKLALASPEKRAEANFKIINEFILDAEKENEPWIIALQEIDKTFNVLLRERLNNYPVTYAHFNRVRGVTGQIIYSPKLKLLNEMVYYFNGAEGNFAHYVNFELNKISISFFNTHLPFKLTDKARLFNRYNYLPPTSHIIVGDTNTMCQIPGGTDPNDKATYWPDLVKAWNDKTGFQFYFTLARTGYTHINPMRNIKDSSQQCDHFDHIIITESADHKNNFGEYVCLPTANLGNWWE